MRAKHAFWMVVAGAVVVAALPAQRAEACGGFFCGQTPVTQAGEHLLFAVDEHEDGSTTVTAHIQVQYTGNAADFAWVLPLPAVPTLSVGSNTIFTMLRQRTDPVYYVTWQDDGGECGGFDPLNGGLEAEDGAGSDADSDSDAEPPGVEIVAQREVGPYETIVIRSTNGDARELLTWLEDNDYVVPEIALPALQAYVNAGHVFLGLKLANDRSAGDIQPIVATFEEEAPCIPLMLTAIAANPDMPVYAWVLGPSGVTSVGDYFEVQVNPAAIDWFRASWWGTSNYAAVATKAVNEAGGKGFIREQAGSTDFLRQTFYVEGQYDLDALRGADDPAQFVNLLLEQGFPRDSTMQDLLREFIPMPDSLVDAGVDERDFYNCLDCYADELAELDFDPEAFVARLDEVILAPLRNAQDLVDQHPYITRVFTTISPEEMTLDPIFRFAADMPDVDNRHVAEARYLCEDGDDYDRAPIRLTYPDGSMRVLRPGDEDYPDPNEWQWVDEDGDGANDNVGAAPTDMPSLLRAVRHDEDTSIEGYVVVDNTQQIRGRLAETRATGGGCSMAGGPASNDLAAGAMALVGLALTLRRRRGKTA